MSYMEIKWAREQQIGNPSGKAILVDLAIRCNDAGVCWPGQETIALATDLSERTVLTWLQELEDRGYIKRKHRQRKNGSRTSDLIELQMPEDDREHPRKSNMYEVREGNNQTVPRENQTATASPPELPVRKPEEEKEMYKEKENVKDVDGDVYLAYERLFEALPQKCEDDLLESMTALKFEFPNVDFYRTAGDYISYVEENPRKYKTVQRSFRGFVGRSRHKASVRIRPSPLDSHIAATRRQNEEAESLEIRRRVMEEMGL